MNIKTEIFKWKQLFRPGVWARRHGFFFQQWFYFKEIFYKNPFENILIEKNYYNLSRKAFVYLFPLFFLPLLICYTIYPVFTHLLEKIKKENQTKLWRHSSNTLLSLADMSAEFASVYESHVTSNHPFLSAPGHHLNSDSSNWVYIQYVILKAGVLKKQRWLLFSVKVIVFS